MNPLGLGWVFVLGMSIAMLINALWGEGVVAVVVVAIAFPLIVTQEVIENRTRRAK